MLADANIQIPVIHDDSIDKNEMHMMVMLVVVLEKCFNVEDNPLMTMLVVVLEKCFNVEDNPLMTIEFCLLLINVFCCNLYPYSTGKSI